MYITAIIHVIENVINWYNIILKKKKKEKEKQKKDLNHRNKLKQININIFKTSLFPNPMMDLVYVWYDDRHWSKILLSIIPTPMHDLKVKVTDLELLCQSFTLKFLGPHYFQTLWWIWFIFGMMIDTGPEFYSVPFPPPCMTLRSRSRT